MNSKEALNNIKKLFIGSPINLTQQFEIIEKDLDRLEKLGKENKELNDFKYIFINCKKLTPLPKIPELEKYNKNTKKHHKELEILDILKTEIFNKMQCFDLDEGWYDDSFCLNKNQIKIIKEWLNDK